MKSTKYQLLKDDYDFACKQLKLYKEKVEQLEKECKQAYYNGYKQGRYDEQKKNFNGIDPQNLTSICLKCGIDLSQCICAIRVDSHE